MLDVPSEALVDGEAPHRAAEGREAMVPRRNCEDTAAEEGLRGYQMVVVFVPRVEIGQYGRQLLKVFKEP